MKKLLATLLFVPVLVLAIPPQEEFIEFLYSTQLDFLDEETLALLDTMTETTGLTVDDFMHIVKDVVFTDIHIYSSEQVVYTSTIDLDKLWEVMQGFLAHFITDPTELALLQQLDLETILMFLPEEIDIIEIITGVFYEIFTEDPTDVTGSTLAWLAANDFSPDVTITNHLNLIISGRVLNLMTLNFNQNNFFNITFSS
ncbi:MAG: hypothetical protein FWE37_02455 [Spirochaetaceae bacterium]|nr:hypothetical protein [Spirochaetaceae bacterium]